MSLKIKKTKKVSNKPTNDETVEPTKSNNEEPIDIQIKRIDTNIEKLENISQDQTINMANMLEVYNETKEYIDVINNKLNDIKQDFNNSKKSTKTIDETLFSQYLNEINSFANDIEKEDDIQKLVKIYKKMYTKICLCEQYLSSKKIDIKYCD